MLTYTAELPELYILTKFWHLRRQKKKKKKKKKNALETGKMLGTVYYGNKEILARNPLANQIT